MASDISQSTLIQEIHFKALSYVHTCAERLRSGDGRIFTFPLRYRGYFHTYTVRMRADLRFLYISCGQSWFGARGFEADAENWVLDPFVVERILLPLRLRSATAYVWTHVMICFEVNFPPASARACVNVPLQVPNHYLNQYWLIIVNWTLRNIF